MTATADRPDPGRHPNGWGVCKWLVHPFSVLVEGQIDAFDGNRNMGLYERVFDAPRRRKEILSAARLNKTNLVNRGKERAPAKLPLV